ncbi:hypothetical protein QBC33DRAFT_383340 [Phialemonium atrogriseum]|uniref:Uncharacterized protein n=1 Tax=Phialemonium atrogriseum TaxID=1093897 RepID=A0AAJ0C1T1_9PEZI|nr:uncharacterized protein QBC33DRAFT_383340 [Phialemonium atrogriseum]KAK1768575.1 hypothetical protein QBC33DRAFT_383340 [Phialemonium atrogriseum]
MTPRLFLPTRQTSHPPTSSHPPGVKRKYVCRAKSNSSSSSNVTTAAMACNTKTSDSRPSPTLSPPRTTTTLTQPITPTNPVQIPVKQKRREHTHPPKPHRHHGDRRHQPGSHRPSDVHSPDAIPPSVAALLALTTIPPPKGSRPVRHRRILGDERMTVDSIIGRTQESEKELSLTLSRNPMDLLLSAPEDLEVDVSMCEGSDLLTRTVSLDSMPSLGGSFTTETFSSVETPFSSSRSRKSQPTRRPLEPVSAPHGELDDHPLSSRRIDIEQLDFRVFDSSLETDVKPEMRLPFRPLKSAFKSNLTASLRALRQAARSFSALNFPSIPPEDFLTRSILTIDPQVPYTDERRPPPLEEEPTAALRRYLNPTTRARIEQPRAAAAPMPTTTARPYTASIQMQTYKVQRARVSSGEHLGRFPRPSPGSPPRASRAGASPAAHHQRGRGPAAADSDPDPLVAVPGPRQREMRENSDFIRIAVMEMAMRKRGKLDDQRPGRARWALPPRRVSPRPYVVGADGVPARWVAVTHGTA